MLVRFQQQHSDSAW